MKESISIIFFCVFTLIQNTSISAQPIDGTYINGNWLIDGDFKKQSFYIKDGVFTKRKNVRKDTIINLEGSYVIPPLGDAHTHNFDGADHFDSLYNLYLQEGTFYVQVLTNHVSKRKEIKDLINKPDRIDVTFANAGLTSIGGHPHNAYVTQALNLNWRAIFNPDGKKTILESRAKNRDAYFLLNSKEDVEEVWPEILSHNPDLIKIYISNIKDHKKLVLEGRIGNYGLSEEVARFIIDLAHKAGLRVFAHIETVEDLRLGLFLGVDGFAHMPGYGGGRSTEGYGMFITPDETLSYMASKQIPIIPTVLFAPLYNQRFSDGKMKIDSVNLKKTNTFIEQELLRYIQAGVPVALGADQHLTTLTPEIEYIKTQMPGITNVMVLNMLTIDGPKTIFPKRKIAAFKEGYEASFLVLHSNPLENLNALKHIKLGVKQGYHILKNNQP